MNRTALSDALAPLASRFPTVVREHEILRVFASVGGSSASDAAEAARREILVWAQRRSGGRLPAAAWEFQNFEFYSGGRNSVGVRIRNESSDIWAIRADDPDKSVPGRIWTTEVVVGGLTGQQPRFSARLLVSSSEDELSIEPHSPGFVQQVAETCGLSLGPQLLDPSSWLVDTDDEANRLVELMVDPSRRLPLFVLTVPESSGDLWRPLVNADDLARAVLGIGQVAVLPANYTWRLTERFGKHRSVFGGAVRAYLPGFTAESDPYGHRLVVANLLATPEGVAQCNRWMKSLAATESIRRSRLGDQVLAFAGIRNASLELSQKRLKEEGATDREQLEAANARIAALEAQMSDNNASLQYFAEEHKKAEERSEAAEAQLRANAFRIQQLNDQLKARGDSPDMNIQLPTNWADFAAWCDSQLAGRVVLSPPARRGVRAPEFEDIQLAARCLVWLATECRDRRLGESQGSIAEEPIEEGVRNSHCGGDQFDLDWQGQRYTADWHVKSGGNTRDPKRCLRIYYFWEPSTQQIVIAEMPAHRRTAAS